MSIEVIFKKKKSLMCCYSDVCYSDFRSQGEPLDDDEQSSSYHGDMPVLCIFQQSFRTEDNGE